MDSELLTVPEAAALLRLKPSTIRAWVCQKRIPFVKMGRLVRIKRADAEAIISSNTVPIEPPTEQDPVINKIEEILNESKRTCFEGHVEILFNVGFPEFIRIVEADGVTQRNALANPLYDPQSTAWQSSS
jgi:excisionase family DNA binding protein